MAFVMQLGQFSIVLKAAWAGWLVAAYALIVWRRRGRTETAMRPVIARPRKAKAEATQSSKRRWRLRANEDATVLQSSSLLGLRS
jgi:3-methyladenine DNA glycosylase AlkC